MDNFTVMSGEFSSAVDQWSFDSLPNSKTALQAHWDTWFTQDDVKRLASYGFNALRIPIGYWAYNNTGTPYHSGADAYLEDAIEWARDAGMKVLVDCHGSPGSQNGQAHSGHKGAVQWQEGNNLELSTAALQLMVQKYGQMQYADVVFGLGIVSK